MRLYVVLDMVGQAFDAGWVDAFTARDLIAEFGGVPVERAMALLMGTETMATEEAMGEESRWSPDDHDLWGGWSW